MAAELGSLVSPFPGRRPSCRVAGNVSNIVWRLQWTQYESLVSCSRRAIHWFANADAGRGKLAQCKEPSVEDKRRRWGGGPNRLPLCCTRHPICKIDKGAICTGALDWSLGHWRRALVPRKLMRNCDRCQNRDFSRVSLEGIPRLVHKTQSFTLPQSGEGQNPARFRENLRWVPRPERVLRGNNGDPNR